jgi:hypothetical protein
MIEALQLIGALDQLTGWLFRLKKGRREKVEDSGEALRAVMRAVTKTRAYVDSRRATLVGDTELERELADLWADACIRLRPVNVDLSRKCELKWELWTDHGAWTPQQIEDAGIAIEQIIDDIRALIE